MSTPVASEASASAATSQAAAGQAKQANAAKEAKVAAKAAKAQRRAAAKGIQPGEQQQQQQEAHQQAQKNSLAQESGSRTTKSAGQASQQASTSAAGAASSAASPAPSGTPASLASSNARLLQGINVSSSSAANPSQSKHDLISTVHPAPSSASHRSQLLTSSLSRGLHPSVVLLQQHLASHTLLGSSARAIATLAALRDFVADYKTPKGAVLNRDLVAKLGHQISGITSARPLGTSAGNAVRYLKYEISVIPAEMGEEQAKSHLISRIDHFVRDRIIFAARVISSHVSNNIKPQGDVILTYARSSVVEQCLVDAYKKAGAGGKRFEVVCVGGETFEEGKRLVESLLSHGIPTSYVPLASLASVLPRVTLVLLGTASLLSNGALYSRAGTATVAMMAHHKKIPVIVCCETFKFSERVRLEGVGGNERADASTVLNDVDDGGSNTASTGQVPSAMPSNLSSLNLLYDLTPATYITAVASEAGLSGPESVAILLRDYKSILFGS